MNGPSNQFLSRPSFSRNQYSGVCLRQSLNEFKDFQHFGTLADYVFKDVFLLDIFLLDNLSQLPNFFQKSSFLNKLLAHEADGLRFDRFGNVVTRPRFISWNSSFTLPKAVTRIKSVSGLFSRMCPGSL